MNYGIKPLLGDRFVDGMLQGSYWDKNSIVVSLSNGWNGETWNDAEQISNHLINATYQMIRFTGLEAYWMGSFSDPAAAYYAGSDINLTIDSEYASFDGDGAWARGFFPNTASRIYAGDIVINANSAANFLPSYAPGSKGFFLLLHELGHALGLKHPHDDGAANRPTFTELGLEQWDLDLLTIMSYNETNFDLLRYKPATPMILDILALQHLYGVNTTENMDNTEWSLVETTHYETILDLGGDNTLTLTDASAGWTVKSPEDSIGSSTTPIGWAYVESDSDLPETFFWIGGNFNRINGSSQADFLTSGEGNTVINGGSGNDVMRGSLGDDMFDPNPFLRAGEDKMEGGGGDDLYFIDHPADLALELPNDGYDTIRLVGPDTWTLPSEVEALVSESTGELNLWGNELDNHFNLAIVSGRIDGGGGKNQLTIQQNSTDAHINIEVDKATLTSKAQKQQLDVLNIETVSFKDQDISIAALTKLAVAPTNAIEKIATLYTAYFDRAPDADGLRYWVSQYQNGFAIESIANSFYMQPEAERLTQLSTEKLVDNAYTQLFERLPDEVGFSYWLRELTDRKISRPEFLLALTDAALSSTGSPADAHQVSEKIDLAVYFAWERGLSDLDAATTIIRSDLATGSLSSAKSVVDTFYQSAYSDPDEGFLITFTGLGSSSTIADQQSLFI